MAELEAAQERIEQLEQALQTRIVIEQAKGVLAERFGSSIAEAFQLLRYAARSSRISLHRLADEIVSTSESPPAITIALARGARWRAAHMREHAEHQRERARQLETQGRAQQERLAWEQAGGDPDLPRPDRDRRDAGRITVIARSRRAATALVELLTPIAAIDRVQLPSGERLISVDYASTADGKLRRVLGLVQGWVDEFGATEISIGDRRFTMSPHRSQ